MFEISTTLFKSNSKNGFGNFPLIKFVHKNPVTDRKKWRAVPWIFIASMYSGVDLVTSYYLVTYIRYVKRQIWRRSVHQSVIKIMATTQNCIILWIPFHYYCIMHLFLITDWWTDRLQIGCFSIPNLHTLPKSLNSATYFYLCSNSFPEQLFELRTCRYCHPDLKICQVF